MNFSIEQVENVQIIKANNLLLEYENNQLLLEIDALIEEGKKHFVADLSSLNFINSIGLSFLLSVLTKTRNAGGDLHVSNIQDQVAKLFIVTKLKSLFVFFESNRAAIDAFKTKLN